MRQEDFDKLVEERKGDVDRTLVRENLRLTPHERLVRLQELHRFAKGIRAAGERARKRRR
jgi:hypothetical protein